MENFDYGVFLLGLCFVILAIAILVLVLGFFGYKLHISGKKIEILPAKESPRSKR